ncbi:hypothetical protein V1525DRAFT_429549 [Lipomyces kononenkoae]|uniref:Uncharacterized protein n=1 Tax=Lipomyces kononenkoae TaxID=34357 RepID=A0ACC3TAG6_LIPKO
MFSIVSTILLNILVFIEVWICRISIVIAFLLMGPTAMLITYDIALYIWRTMDSSAAELVLKLKDKSTSLPASPIRESTPSGTATTTSTTTSATTTTTTAQSGRPMTPSSVSKKGPLLFYRRLIWRQRSQCQAGSDIVRSPTPKLAQPRPLIPSAVANGLEAAAVTAGSPAPRLRHIST